MNFSRHVLLNTLKKELRFETSLDQSILYLSEFVRKHGFVQKTSESTTKVNLYKQCENYKFQVEFVYRTPQELKKKEDSDDEEQENDSFKDEISMFYLSVQRNPQENLHFECFTYDSQIWIQHMLFTHSMPDNISQVFTRVRGRTNFNVLNENLQQLIVEWIKEIGINDDLGKFVEIMSLYKEKELYKKWMTNIITTLE